MAIKYRINRLLALKWFKDRIKIIKAASSEHKKHLKIRPARKYLALYDFLLRVFKTARSKGYFVDFNWLWSKARVLYREMTNDPEVTVRKHVIVNFLKRNKIYACEQRNRNTSKESFREPLKQWHASTRERFIRTSANNAAFDVKWGSFTPKNRLNVDQTPCPFAFNTKRTYLFEEGTN